ncbi:MAG: GCN5-related N-acetyltransferase [Herbinix sp.]|jgi:SAM-dependent methyltransferase|nr:GCN5-related N-acetyltransferase [Herbinix sp.]
MRNLIHRVNLRIRQEGFLRTAKYILYVFYYTFCEKFYNVLLDLHYSRRLLKGNQKTAYKVLGANDVYHTKYCAMPLIFHFVQITDKDVLVDVGCGKGRVINYLLSRKLRNKIYGLELDPLVANQTKKQFARWKNVTILSGDAISNLPSEGTIFYFYNPFTEEKVKLFEETLSQKYKNRKITVIYYNPKSIHAFQNGKWKIKYINFEQTLGIKRWGRINKYHDLAIIKLK